MDRILDGNPLKLEVIGCCGGDKKNGMTTQNQHSRIPKKQKQKTPHQPYQSSVL